MNNPQLSPRQSVFQAIRSLNDLLTTKLHGEHLLFPSEKALNASIKERIHYVNRHPDLHSVFRRCKQEYSSWFKIHLWLLENMVAAWNDVGPLNVQEGAELVRLRTELEDADGWRMAVSRICDEEEAEEEEEVEEEEYLS